MKIEEWTEKEDGSLVATQAENAVFFAGVSLIVAGAILMLLEALGLAEADPVRFIGVVALGLALVVLALLRLVSRRAALLRLKLGNLEDQVAKIDNRESRP